MFRAILELEVLVPIWLRLPVKTDVGGTTLEKPERYRQQPAFRTGERGVEGEEQTDVAGCEDDVRVDQGLQVCRLRLADV